MTLEEETREMERSLKFREKWAAPLAFIAVFVVAFGGMVALILATT